MVFLFLLLLIYLLFFAFSILGFFKLKNKTSPILDSYIVSNLTVIIPFRNEESRIFGLLESIQKQTDLEIVKEFLFIDDHSNDNSVTIISRWIDKNKINARIIYLKRKYGKKHAISIATKMANTSHIMTLDADVNFKENFFSNIKKNIFLERGLYIFPVVENNGLIFSQIESHVLSIISIGMLNLKIPILANGACLVYSKEDFLTVEPYKNNYNISSGDDLFILQFFKKNNIPIKAVSPFLLNVCTAGPEKIKPFFHRSLRWAGKMHSVKLPLTKFFGAVILLTNFFSTLMFFRLLVNPNLGYESLYISVKFFLDLMVVFLALKHYKNLKLFIYIFPMFLFYPIGLLINCSLIIFGISPYWKGRKVINISG